MLSYFILKKIEQSGYGPCPIIYLKITREFSLGWPGARTYFIVQDSTMIFDFVIVINV